MIYDHAYWLAYLAKGIRKAKTVSRAINKHKNQRVVLLSNGDIGLRYHSTYCIIVHQDGTFTYNTGGWDTVTTKAFLNEYGPVRVFSEKGSWFLSMANPTITEPKVRKCRKCYGKTTLPSSCYGPSWCYPPYGNKGPCAHGETTGHRREQCSHGETASHALPDVECWRCKGSGSVDYGSKSVHHAWAGYPYRFHPDSPETGTHSSVEYYYPATSDWTTGKGKPAPVSQPDPVPYTPPQLARFNPRDYSSARMVLLQAMPDIDTCVGCPCGKDCGRFDRVMSIIVHLNDIVGWTREAIADWLDTLDLNLRFPIPVE